jgi:small subunit ribosomal protein S17
METRNLRKERIGVVTNNKMEKSVVVSEVKRVKHPMYGKFVLKTKKYEYKKLLYGKGKHSE